MIAWRLLDVIGYVLYVEEEKQVANSTSTRRRVTIIDEYDREVKFNVNFSLLFAFSNNTFVDIGFCHVLQPNG
jgi:hypothetical protein